MIGEDLLQTCEPTFRKFLLDSIHTFEDTHPGYLIHIKRTYRPIAEQKYFKPIIYKEGKITKENRYRTYPPYAYDHLNYIPSFGAWVNIHIYDQGTTIPYDYKHPLAHLWLEWADTCAANNLETGIQDSYQIPQVVRLPETTIKNIIDTLLSTVGVTKKSKSNRTQGLFSRLVTFAKKYDGPIPIKLYRHTVIHPELWNLLWRIYVTKRHQM